MKKKINLLILPALFIIAFAAFSGFTQPDKTDQAEQFILLRGEIFQQVYGGVLTPEKAISKLQTLETDTLLKKDTDKLKSIHNNEQPEIQDINIRSIQCKKEYFEYNTYEVWLEWQEKRGNKWHEIDKKFNAVLKETGESRKLSILKESEENLF